MAAAGLITTNLSDPAAPDLLAIDKSSPSTWTTGEYVVWKFTPTESGLIGLDTYLSQTNVASVVTLYILTPDFSSLAFIGGRAEDLYVSLAVTGGVTYWVLIDPGSSDPADLFTLRMSGFDSIVTETILPTIADTATLTHAAPSHTVNGGYLAINGPDAAVDRVRFTLSSDPTTVQSADSTGNGIFALPSQPVNVVAQWAPPTDSTTSPLRGEAQLAGVDPVDVSVPSRKQAGVSAGNPSGDGTITNPTPDTVNWLIDGSGSQLVILEARHEFQWTAGEALTYTPSMVAEGDIPGWTMLDSDYFTNTAAVDSDPDQRRATSYSLWHQEAADLGSLEVATTYSNMLADSGPGNAFFRMLLFASVDRVTYTPVGSVTSIAADFDLSRARFAARRRS